MQEGHIRGASTEQNAAAGSQGAAARQAPPFTCIVFCEVLHAAAPGARQETIKSSAGVSDLHKHIHTHAPISSHRYVAAGGEDDLVSVYSMAERAPVAHCQVRVWGEWVCVCAGWWW